MSVKRRLTDMNETTDHISTRYRRIIGAAIAAVIVGGIIVFVGTGLDWGGFVGGLGLGAGSGLMLVGAYFWGYGNGLRRPLARAGWLPSRERG